MNFSTGELLHLTPELILAAGALILLLTGSWGAIKSDSLRWINLLIHSANLVFSYLSTHVNVSLFSDQITINETVLSSRILIAFAGWLIALSFFSSKIQKQISEYYLFALGLQLGSQITIMASHAITLMLAIELMSISAYALAGFRFRPESSEAGTKIFIFGSAATALMAFGFSWIYGTTGLLTWSSAGEIFRAEQLPQTLTLMGLMLVIAALSFKMTAAPFHWWAPDVYQATPIQVIGLFSTIPKIAVVILIARLLDPSINAHPTRLWLVLIGGLSAVTLLVGNFPALWQKDVRRLMGYSSIGQAGFLLLGLCVSASQVIPVILFYSLTMLIGVILVLYCLNWFETNFNTTHLKDFAGKGRLWTIPGAGLTIGLLSLTGLPPFAGFTAKLFLFSALISGINQGQALLLFLLIFGVLNTVVALFYYLKIPLALFLKNQTSNPVNTATISTRDYAIILTLSTLLVLLFAFPETVLFNN